MRVICLSAGRSSRLMPLTAQIHKSALRVAGWPILDWQMHSFWLAGIRDVVVVAGHGSDETRRLLGAWKNRMAIDIVQNDEFDRRNLDYSLFSASQYLEGNVLYFEGDLLLPPLLLEALADSTSEITIAASGSSKSERVDAIVRRVGNTIHLECSEHGSLDVHGSEGEFICAFKLAGGSAEKLRHKLALSTFAGQIRLYQYLSELMTEFRTNILNTAAQPWIEIDNLADLQRATAVVDAFGFRPNTGDS